MGRRAHSGRKTRLDCRAHVGRRARVGHQARLDHRACSSRLGRHTRLTTLLESLKC